MKVKLTVSYDGTDFCGWQRQSKGISVQETLEDALYSVTGEKIKIVGSGRTDAGVHAEGQTASFSCNAKIPAEKYAKALNTVLPKTVKVIKSESVSDEFDACRKAKKKTYRFSVYVSDVTKPLKDRYAVQIISKPEIDIVAVKKTAKILEGEHDFKAFCASGSQVKTTVRIVYSIKVENIGEDIFFTVTGNGFLYNMVRIMVGVMIMVGKGQFSFSQVENMLKTGDRPMSVKTLPAKGLCLMNVDYC